jgi:hypothetical protein
MNPNASRMDSAGMPRMKPLIQPRFYWIKKESSDSRRSAVLTATGPAPIPYLKYYVLCDDRDVAQTFCTANRYHFGDLANRPGIA